MGKKSRKKSGAPASSESGLPKIDFDSIDNTACALCNKEIDVFHWNFQNTTEFLECCGHSICRDCYDSTHQKKKDEVAQLASLVLDGGGKNKTLPSLASLNKISSPPCVLCKTTIAQSGVEGRARIRRMAEAGHVLAQYLLANEYASNSSHRKEPKAVIKWLQKSAEGGNTYACARMGDRYYDGEDVVQSYEQAKMWYLRGGENPVALQGLGMMYKYGKGVEKDVEKAREYFRQGAVQDYPEALVDYGISLYSAGRFKEALLQFEKVARMEEILSTCMGDLVSKSQLTTAQTLMKVHEPFLLQIDTNKANNPYPLALFWTRRAVKNGLEDAKEYLKTLEVGAHRFCRSCGKWNPQNTCTKCRAVSYCSKACQVTDWKAGHKIACNSLPVLCNYSEDECAHCGQRKPGYECQACEKACYCGEACQRAHWYQGGHKDECKLFS